jgi:TonB-linked SusC/RagA family outer membrane protein
MQKTALNERVGPFMPAFSQMLRIMRMTAFILLAFFLSASANTYSQEVNISGKDLSLKQVFSLVYKQTGYVVFSNERLLERAVPVTVNAKHQPVMEFLTDVFYTQPLTFTVEGKTIFLSERKMTAVADSALIPKLRGRIVDSAGMPISDVTVALRNTKVFTITNTQGEFTLNNVPEDGILLLTSIAFKGRSIKIEGRSSLTISMEKDIKKLDEVEVVLNNGYELLPKERATGSFGVVTTKQLGKYPVVSILERLQGLVPGVDISMKTTANKSRSGTVKIRGLSTIVSSYTKVSTDPLLVIDGFPSQVAIKDGALDFLNPDDVETITFLKDAAAASIWGMQAANGVIVIQTKRGTRNSKPTLSFSTTLGTSSRPTLDYGKRMSVPAYIELEKELISKGRLLDPLPSSNPGSYYPENISQAQEIVYLFRRGTITEAEMNNRLTALGKIDNRSQMEDYMLQSPTTQQYNLSLSGGGTNNSYFLSGYLYKEDRLYRSNTNRGYSIKAGNTSHMANGRFSISTDLTFSNTNDKINGAAVKAMSVWSGGMRPYDLLKDAEGNNLYYDLLVIPKVARDLEGKGYLPFRYSPVDELNYSNTTNTSHNLSLNVALNGKITSWLGVNVSGNIGRMFAESENYWEPDSYDARMLINKNTSLNATGGREYGAPLGGKLDLSRNSRKSYNLRGQINVNKSFNDIHQLSLLFGTEIRETYVKSDGEIRYGYDKTINVFRTVNPGGQFRDIYGTTQTLGATSKLVAEKTTRSLSHYANGSYTLMDKYTLSGSMRFDDYNLLGVERRKRAIPLWSGGVKWDISKEDFLSHVPWLNRLALRATLGTSGNAPQGYAPVTVISILGADFYTTYPYATISTPAVDNLGWEKTRMTNYGIDFSLFSNRVSGSVEYYRKRTTDIIWQLPINSTYGFSNLLFNTAKLQGHGVDVGLTVGIIASRKISWYSTVNASYNTNIIKDPRFERPTTSFDPESLYSGYPSDYVFSYAWAGLDNTGQSLIRDPKNPSKTYTVNEFPFQDIRVYSGRSTSPWIGMWSNTMRYKGLELNVQFQGAFGGVFRKPSIESIGFTNNVFVGRTGDMDERWRKPGDEAFRNVPGMEFGPGTVYSLSIDRYRLSDYLIRSRSNIRLQQVSLSYEVPAHLLARIYTKGLTLSAVARNLGMIWAANKEKLDPEYLYTTGNNYQLPPITNYSFRIVLTL